MALQIPDASPGGFRSYSYQLVAEEDGTQLLFSNDIVRLYLGHVAMCRVRGEEPPAFSAWLDADEDIADVFDEPDSFVVLHTVNSEAPDTTLS